jgi:hypothetical protein
MQRQEQPRVFRLRCASLKMTAFVGVGGESEGKGNSKDRPVLVVSHPCDKNKCVGRVRHPHSWWVGKQMQEQVQPRNFRFR